MALISTRSKATWCKRRRAAEADNVRARWHRHARIPNSGSLHNVPSMKRTILHVLLSFCAVVWVRADPAVQSVQQALQDQGFYYGGVTGEKSAETTAAIRRYQIRNGLQVTGDMNSETLRSLNLNPTSASSAQPRPRSAASQSNSARVDDTSRAGQVSPARPDNPPDPGLDANTHFGRAYGSAQRRITYLDSAPRVYQARVPVWKFKHGKWKLKWKKIHPRHGEEHGDEDEGWNGHGRWHDEDAD